MSSKSLNKVQLIGNVTRDPELRFTPQGNAVCQFGLATNRSWKTENGEIREEAEFHRLVAWNKLAELCAQLCTKGRKIYVEGRLQTRTFTGSDNAQHTITEIVINEMMLLDSKIPGSTPYSGPTEKSAEEEVEPQPVSDSAATDDSAKPKGKKKKEEEAVEEAPANDVVDADDIPF